MWDFFSFYLREWRAMNEQTSRHILVVDDDDGARNLICRVLNQRGFDVLSAASGAAAIQHLNAHGPAVALTVLDMTMPEMDGEHTFAALHQLQPDLRFLLFTGVCDDPALQRLLATGLCTHLNKPCSLALLVEIIHGLLANPPPPNAP
jgi:CheY-like chemotaxis protein